MKVYVKNMVSPRCKMLVKRELEKLSIPYTSIDLGVADLKEKITADQRKQLKENLIQSGLDILNDKKEILIERIKNVTIEMIHYSDELPKVNYSDYISERLDYNYMYLSNIFSEERGMTLQQFIIMHKIERVKELLFYGEYTLSEISIKMHYSSVAHLSNQFRKTTGLSPTDYKNQKRKSLTNLENL